MFNFFKKENALQIVDFLETVLKNLPSEYNIFYRQIKSSFRGMRFEKKPNSNYIEFRHDPANFKMFERRDQRDYMLKGVHLTNKANADVIDMTIYVAGGMVMGISTSKPIKNIIGALDIKYGKLTKQYLQDISDDKLAKIFTDEQLQVINPSEVYEVELDGRLFYHIHDLEDGDFIGVGADKKVYVITHDPYEIKELSTKLSEILKDYEQ